jgi:hypothetical protein
LGLLQAVGQATVHQEEVDSLFCWWHNLRI